MDPFVSLTAIAAALPIANVDTDMILPARFLKTITRQGLGAGAFYGQRFHADGRERPDFVLNRPPWTHAGILIALDNFGCGSSREHAPWALLDIGIRCIIAPRFADIFYGNCFKNGILPVTLERSVVDTLIADASAPATAEMIVDLRDQTIVRSNGAVIPFTVEPQRRERLLAGIDDVAVTAAYEDAIVGHEAGTASERSWLGKPDVDWAAIVGP